MCVSAWARRRGGRVRGRHRSSAILVNFKRPLNAKCASTFQKCQLKTSQQLSLPVCQLFAIDGGEVALSSSPPSSPSELPNQHSPSNALTHLCMRANLPRLLPAVCAQGTAQPGILRMRPGSGSRWVGSVLLEKRRWSIRDVGADLNAGCGRLCWLGGRVGGSRAVGLVPLADHNPAGLGRSGLPAAATLLAWGVGGVRGPAKSTRRVEVRSPRKFCEPMSA